MTINESSNMNVKLSVTVSTLMAALCISSISFVETLPLPGVTDPSSLLDLLSERLREFCADHGVDCSYGTVQNDSDESYANESTDAASRLAALAKLATEKLSSSAKSETGLNDDGNSTTRSNSNSERPTDTAKERSAKWSPLLTIVTKWMNDNTFWLIVLQLLAILGLFVRRWLGSCRRGLERKGYNKANANDPEIRDDNTKRHSFDETDERTDTTYNETQFGGSTSYADRRRTMSMDRVSFPHGKETLPLKESVSPPSMERLRDELKNEIQKSKGGSGRKTVVRFGSVTGENEPLRIPLNDTETNYKATEGGVEKATDEDGSQTVTIAGGNLKRDGSYVDFAPKSHGIAEQTERKDEKRNRWPYNFLRTRTEMSNGGNIDTDSALPSKETIESSISSPPLSVLSRGKTRLKR